MTASRGDVIDSGRGSSAFAGVADTILSLRKPEGGGSPKVRVLRGISRFDGVPPDVALELNDDQEYHLIGDPRLLTAAGNRDAVIQLLSDSKEGGLNIRDLVRQVDVEKTALRKLLQQMVNEAVVSRAGKGFKGDPFRYTIAER